MPSDASIIFYKKKIDAATGTTGGAVTTEAIARMTQEDVGTHDADAAAHAGGVAPAAHTLDSHSTKAHSELTGVGATDHHTAAILESLFTTQNDIIVRGAAAPERLAIAASRIVARLAAGDIVAATAAEILTLIGVEVGATADQTGAEIVTLLEALVGAAKLDHGEGLSGLGDDDHTQYTLKSLFDANTILMATSDDTPVALTVGASTIVGRKSTGNIVALTAAQVVTIIGSSITTLANLTSIQGHTVTLTGAFIRTGAHSLTVRTTGTTDVTLPVTGTLATLGQTEELDNKTLDASVAKGTWTASGTWTVPGFTMAGSLIVGHGAASFLRSVDNNFFSMRGSTSAAGRGAILYLFGKDQANTGAMILYTPNAAGTGDALRLTIGGVATIATWAITNSELVLGGATGGGKGDGTINAKAVYDDDTLLGPDWAFDLYFDKAVKVGDPFWKGQKLYTLQETYDFTRAERHLPWMPALNSEAFEKERSLGNMLVKVWEGQEQQQFHLFGLDSRIEKLERELMKLRALAGRN